jgi:periplasmic protein TonB
MFRESLLEDCAERGARRWTTLTSFALQIAAACLCVVLPLFYPEALPLMHANAEMLMSPPSGAPPRAVDVTVVHHPNTPLVERENPLVIHAPGHVPDRIDMTADKHAPRDPSTGFYVPGQIPSDGTERASDFLTQLIDTPKMHPVMKQPVNSMRVSPGVVEGLLLNRIEPHYPEIPRRAHIQGDVVLAATIGRDGRIENLHVVSGHPLLAQAALDAVRQWRYRPYMLGTEAVEVETQVTVRFRLNGDQ